MSGRWPLAPWFCSRKTRKSQLILFHKNHNLGNLDFTGSEHRSPYNNIVFKEKLSFGGGGGGGGGTVGQSQRLKGQGVWIF